MNAGAEGAIRAAFAQQAVWCRNLGSPLTGLIVEAAGQQIDRSTAIGRRILDWPGRPDARFDALPLRFAGGLHALVRRGRLPCLAALYPPHPLPSAGRLWDAVAAALAEAGADLDPWLDSAPQTNETARAAALMAGLMAVTHETGLPLALFELGASAGLNLVLDRYGYRLGPVRTGVDGSPVQLAPRWDGPAPPQCAVQIVRRSGVDLNPLDVTRSEHRERLLAYIWADQDERLARARAAITLAAADPPPLAQGDAAEWTEAQLSPAPEPGVARVLMHSIAFQYFGDATQQRIRAHVNRIGDRATDRAPFAWLRFEVDPRHGARPALQLTLWPGGGDRVLATGSPHGLWIEWIGAQ